MPSDLAASTASPKSFCCSATRKLCVKSRSSMRWPWFSKINELAAPPMSACRTLPGSAPALLAKSSASATASTVMPTMIWLATLQTWPSPLRVPIRVMVLPMTSKSVLTRSNARSGPPPIMVSSPLMARSAPNSCRRPFCRPAGQRPRRLQRRARFRHRGCRGPSVRRYRRPLRLRDCSF